MAYGGRLAEEIIYGSERVSTGASQDIKYATSIARNMVTQWGFSEKLGPVLYAEDENEVFLGRSMGKSQHMSDETASIIDYEVKTLIDNNYQRAQTYLQDNMDILHAMKDALMKYETIDSNQIADLMDRKEVRAPVDWNMDDNGSSNDKGGKSATSEDTAEDEVQTEPEQAKAADVNEIDESTAK